MSRSFSDLEWEDAYDMMAVRYLDRYFGGTVGLTNAFPTMRNGYPWAASRPAIPDSRVTAKNNNEYHGLESLAGQYHASAMYAEASHHWLMAAYWRQIDKTTHGFRDAGHDKAVSFCLKNFQFNEALEKWSTGGGVGPAPETTLFGLTDEFANRIESKGQQILDNAFRAGSAPENGSS